MTKSTSKQFIKPTAIYTIDAGWVIAGVGTPTTTVTGEPAIRIDDAVVIRRWGTTDGLGQLAISGPTSDTILDKCTVVCLPTSRILFTMAVESGEWEVKPS